MKAVVRTLSQRWQLSLTLAWRYLWRNYRRTIIMLLAIVVGVWAMLFMIAMMRGMVDDMVEGSVQNFVGHVQIHHPRYRDDPSIVNRLEEPDEALQDYFREHELRWTSRLRVPAVISSERESLGVVLMGVEPESELQLSQIPRQITAGEFLQSADAGGIVIGNKLARRLDTRLGKRVVLMSQDPDNDIADRGFRVVGIYSADLPSLEERFVFVGLETAQQMLGVGRTVSEIEIHGPDYRNVDWIVDDLSALKPELEVTPWYELDAYTGGMLTVMDGFVFVWIIVVFLALSFGLVNTLVMAVFERTREIGLIMALGMRPSAILAQVLVETFFLLVLGLALGNLLMVATAHWLAEGINVSPWAQGLELAGMPSRLRLVLTREDMLLANTMVIILGLLAGLLPAFRASRYNPVEALNKT